MHFSRGTSPRERCSLKPCAEPSVPGCQRWPSLEQKLVLPQAGTAFCHKQGTETSWGLCWQRVIASYQQSCFCSKSVFHSPIFVVAHIHHHFLVNNTYKTQKHLLKEKPVGHTYYVVLPTEGFLCFTNNFSNTEADKKNYPAHFLFARNANLSLLTATGMTQGTSGVSARFFSLRGRRR